VILEKKEKPWMKYVHGPKYQTLKLFKKLRDENTPGEEKVTLLQEFEAKKSELPEDEKKWLEEKIAKRLSTNFCDRPQRPMIFKAMKLLKHSYEKETTAEEKIEIEKKFSEIMEKLPEDQRARVEEKRAKFSARAQEHDSHSSKKLKLADAFSEFLKTNFNNVVELVGDQFKGKPHCREMKKLIEELCMTFSALPEAKQAEVSTLLNGVPEKMIVCMKLKHERKEERRKEKENKLENPSTLEEEKLEPKQEKKEKHHWHEKRERFGKCHRFDKEKREKKSKSPKKEKSSEKKEKKSKSPKKDKSVEKKTMLETATETIKEGVATVTQAVQDAAVAAKEALSKKKYAPGVIAKANQIREVFPDADVDSLNEFVKQNFKLTIEQLIDEFLHNYKN